MDTAKLISLLKTCTTAKSLNKGKLVHQKIISSGLQTNVALCKNLIEFYFSCHHHNSGKLVFQNIHNPFDISLWNGLLASYTKNFLHGEALQLFDNLLHYPYLKPDCFTYPSVLKACSGLARIHLGQTIHAHLVKSGSLWDVFIASSILRLYAKCREFEYAVKMFDEMPQRDAGCWNTMISCYLQGDRPKKALEMFWKMKLSGFEPNSVTLTIAISSCARLLDLEKGKEMHKELIRKGSLIDGFIASALVDMYGKCGSIELAREVFEQIPQKNVIAWNSIIAGYSLMGDSNSCIELFKRMNYEQIRPTLTTISSMLLASSRSAQLKHGKFIHGYVTRNRIEVDIHIKNSLIEFYFKCGSVTSSESIFRNMLKNTNVVSWNVMISGYVNIGNYFDALLVFDKMMKDDSVKPDSVTFTSILPACSQLAALEKGREIHDHVIGRKLERNEIVIGALLDMYAKCGAVEDAEKVFYELPERYKDLVSWTSMIMAYGSHGHALEALKLYNEMQRCNLKPDGVTFLAVLSACSHAGLVDEGCYYFNEMIVRYDIKPSIEHFSCLIDLLGRGGRLIEAYEILQNSPETKMDIGLLSTLFSASRLHNNLGLGIEIAEKIIAEDPDDPSAYILLSNMYASQKKWDEVRKVRSKMKELGLKKNPGCSWIEVNKTIYSFFVEDKSNPRGDIVYECLAILAAHMEKYEFNLC